MAGVFVAYGLLIPNRWQRTAGMLAFMLLLGFTSYALFGAYRIDTATTVARDALRLGQYVLLERLGSGGMGEVHLAEHRLLCRPCVIKLIRPEHAGDAEITQAGVILGTPAYMSPNSAPVSNSPDR